MFCLSTVMLVEYLLNHIERENGQPNLKHPCFELNTLYTNTQSQVLENVRFSVHLQLRFVDILLQFVSGTDVKNTIPSPRKMLFSQRSHTRFVELLSTV